MSVELLQEMIDDPSVPVAMRTRLFDGLDRINRRMGIYRKFLKFFDSWFLKNHLHLSSQPLRILELGAGNGGLILQLTTWASKRGVNIEFHVMDPDPDVLKWCQNRLLQKGIKIIPHLSGDKHLAQFQDKAFDFVYSLYVLHHIQPQAVLKDALRDSLRVARNGVFMMDFNRRSYNSLLKYTMYLGIPFYGADWVLNQKLARDGVISVKKAYADDEIGRHCKELIYDFPERWNFNVKPFFHWLPYFILTLQKV